MTIESVPIYSIIMNLRAWQSPDTDSVASGTMSEL
jgi:hypothetical protein